MSSGCAESHARLGFEFPGCGLSAVGRELASKVSEGLHTALAGHAVQLAQCTPGGGNSTVQVGLLALEPCSGQHRETDRLSPSERADVGRGDLGESFRVVMIF